MDKLIHRHLDARMDIQEVASEQLQSLVGSMSLDAILKNPEQELARLGMQALEIVKERSQDAADEGQRFAAEIKEAGKIKPVEEDAGAKDNAE